MRPWRMKEKCEDCPFHETGPGKFLRDTLAPGRFASICKDLRKEKTFFCHKTTQRGEETEDGDYIAGGEELICAGAIEYQEKHNCVPQVVQVMGRLERIKSIKENGHAKF